MKRLSIRLRLMVLMICLTTLPVLTVTWIAALNTRASVETEIVNANESRMAWADQFLSETIRQIETVFTTLQINETLMQSMSDMAGADAGAQLRSQNYIRSSLTSVLYANTRRMEELTLYVHDKQMAYSVDFSGSGALLPMRIDAGDWSRIGQGPVHLYFEPAANGIYAFHSINRFEDRMLLGGLSARIDGEVWKELTGILQSEKESSVYLLNDRGKLLTLSGFAETPALPKEIAAKVVGLPPSESKPRFWRTEDSFYFMKSVDDGELAFVKAVPLKTVRESADSTIRAGILTGSLFAAASLLLSVLVSLRISRPIVRLAKTMRMADPNQLAFTAVYTRDEIGLLERGYNSLVQRVKELIEHEYQNEIDVKNAQLAALQAQINPHFLNNTLHMIGGMALAKNAPEIYQVTRVIGELLRYSISQGEELVPLEDELKHMNNYLFIQQQRFAGRCRVTASNEYEGPEIRIPKFTLQPIVENAFEHGLQRKEGEWRLDIKIVRAGSRVLVLVKDGGAGMTESRLNGIREELRGETGGERLPPGNGERKRGKGIGLKNVDARLRLRFGTRYRLRIFSKEGEGTLIAAALPTERGGGSGHAQSSDH